MKVLIVDDSRVMRQIVQRTLRQAGYDALELLEASNGLEAYDAVQSHSPDLVLSDWNMPEMTGIELLKALRGGGSQVPFCFVTSEGSDDMREQATQAGAMGLIAKPFTSEGFMDVLSSVVA